MFAGITDSIDPQQLLRSFGTIGLIAIIFAESGLLIGFFLPGDSLLFTAGLLCASTNHSAVHLSLPAVLVAAAAGALAGAETGYFIGRGAGQALLTRPDRPRLRDGVHRARTAIQRYGPRRAVVLARFIPVVRTVMNPLAGAIGIPLALFTVWQAIGGLLWTVGLTLAGYALGSRVSGIDHYLLPIVAVIVVVSLIPLAVEVLRRPRRHSGDDHEDCATPEHEGSS